MESNVKLIKIDQFEALLKNKIRKKEKKKFEKTKLELVVKIYVLGI